MVTHDIHYRETSARLTCQRRYLEPAWQALRAAHNQLRAYILQDRNFLHSFSFVNCSPAAPRIAVHMAAAAGNAGTGPMAAVAGAIGLAVVGALAEAGAKHVVFENGGDITMILERAVTVGIYCGPRGPQGLGLRINTLGRITACCTSSGTVGHSFSYGRADAAVVLADDPVLADATATALGNRLRYPGTRSLKAALQNTPHQGVRTMIAVMDGKVAYQGETPAWLITRPFPCPDQKEIRHVPA